MVRRQMGVKRDVAKLERATQKRGILGADLGAF